MYNTHTTDENFAADHFASTTAVPTAFLSPFERLVTGVLVLCILVSGTTLLYRANNSTLVTFPREGGTYREGLIGTPRFINPLLSATETDQDLTSLVYAGLMTRNESGALVPELAEGYSLSEDKLVYTFTLRHNLTFHDGAPLTAADVVYTIEQAQKPTIRSPYGVHWEGVTVEAPDEYTVVFTLPEPYEPFIENTTIGILPKHIWSGLTPETFPFSQFNVTPVGAGPYQVTKVTRDRSGIPSHYELDRFEYYPLGRPFIEHITCALFSNTTDALQALSQQEIDAVHGVSPSAVQELMVTGSLQGVTVHRAPQLRTYAIYFNQNRQRVFLHDEVRAALDATAPRREIVDRVLYGYGTIIDSPIPPFAVVEGGHELSAAESPHQGSAGAENASSTDTEVVLAHARTLLEAKGWKRREEDGVYVHDGDDGAEELAFTISTVNIPELAQAAEIVANTWRTLGARVEVKVYEADDLTQSVIRPRKYEALLFGTVIGHELDLYAFWHSSQRTDPGLNIAEYTDIESDAMLEKARTEIDSSARTAQLAAFTDHIRKQHAAVFLHAPDFLYIARDTIRNISLHPINVPEERFDTVHTWYINEEHLWPFVRDWLDDSE